MRLRQDDLDYLDDQVRAIKRAGGDRSLTRSEVMRAIVAALRDAGVDLSAAADEESVEALVHGLFRG